ncbi:MAG: MgtC/SapB family protein, partial [Thermoleophilaceae bacterium]
FLLGALAHQDPGLAAGLGVATAILLAGRERLHRLVRDTLSEREVHDALLFAACALIVLPLVPDKGIGPHHSLNPATVWRLVVIVMAMQGVGYIVQRAIGARYGLLLVGLIGGFVSSTATIGTMGARAASEPQLRRGATAAAVVSSVATIVLLAIVVGAVSTDALRQLALPLILSGLAAGGYAALFAVRAARSSPQDEELDRGRAFDPRVALVLALTVSVVLLVSGAINVALGRTGVVLGTAVAGFADSQSAAISAATLSSEGQVATSTAVLATLAALSTNTISKAVLAGVLGKRRFALQVWPGLALILVAAWGGWALQQAF